MHSVVSLRSFGKPLYFFRNIFKLSSRFKIGFISKNYTVCSSAFHLHYLRQLNACNVKEITFFHRIYRGKNGGHAQANIVTFLYRPNNMELIYLVSVSWILFI